MRVAKSTLIGAAVAVALFGANAFAQQTTPTDGNQGATGAGDGDGGTPPTLQEVVVSGIRYSVRKSLALKRAATNNIEVMTATDVGRLPAQNAADVLQTMPGVMTQSSVAGEGGFAINDRVSLLGTPPLLTQVTVDGHYVSSGDWFVEDQYETVGRSVSFDLFPATMISSVTAYQSQDASLLQGGVAGSVDVQTPKPFDFKSGFHGFANAGANYWDLPGKANPQGSLELSWHNDFVGILGQVFYQKQSIRRDGQEELGYQTISACTAVGGAVGSSVCGGVPGWQLRNPSLPNASNALMPSLLGEALFEQTQENSGGLLDLQLKPSDRLAFDLTGFYSKLLASNFNDNFMMWGSHFVSPTYVPTSLTVQNGAVVAGSWPNEPGAPGYADSIVYDQIMRPDAAAQSSFVNLDGSWDATDELTVDGQLGFTYGEGKTPGQYPYEYIGGDGVSYRMNGLSSLASVQFPGVATNNPAGYGVSWASVDRLHSIDKETYGKLGSKLKLNDGALEDLRVGVRFSHHEHESQWPMAGGFICSGTTVQCSPTWSGGEYPGDYGSTLPGGGAWANNIFMDSESSIEAFDSSPLNINTTPGQRYYWLDSFDLAENDLSAYFMADVGGDRWSGNFGVRIVNTLEEVMTNVAGGTHPLTFSAFGPFTPTEVDNRYFNVLPSVNLKFDITHRLIARFGAAESIAMPDYSTLGGGITLTDTNLTGSGGNPSLQPIKGAVYSTDLEYYYGPESMLEAKVFDIDMSSYVDFGNSQGTYFDQNTNSMATFTITSPFNIPAQIRGAVLAWDQALPFGLGLNTNVTLSEGSTGAGGPVLDNSRWTYNIMGYYQHGPVSANIDYTYRSHYYAAVSEASPQNMADAGFLNLQVSYDILRDLSLTFSARNLGDELVKEYGQNLAQPVAIYNNGRQFYLTAQYKF
jgi:iron complex outermembrane receptor protein